MSDAAKINGLDEARRAVRVLAQRVANPAPLMTKLAFGLAKMWQDNIDAGPNDRWEAGPSLRVQATGGTTLRDRGVMKASIQGAVTSPQTVEIGSALTVRASKGDVPLLAVHEFGTTIRPVHGKALRFKMPFAASYRIVSLAKGKEGKRLKTGVAEGEVWATVQKVRIPRPAHVSVQLENRPAAAGSGPVHPQHGRRLRHGETGMNPLIECEDAIVAELHAARRADLPRKSLFNAVDTYSGVRDDIFEQLIKAHAPAAFVQLFSCVNAAKPIERIERRGRRSNRVVVEDMENVIWSIFVLHPFAAQPARAASRCRWRPWACTRYLT